MIPILFPAAETSFTTQGIGRLTDALSCVVTEERNGSYELELQYPEGGVNFSSIQTQAIILAKPNTYDDPQPFRIYAITKPLEGICTINARHISYDLSGAIVLPPSGGIVAQNAGQAMTQMAANADGAAAFTFSSDNATQSTFQMSVPASFRSMMGGVQGSILDVFGGEYHYDKFLVENLAARGEDRGYTIRYGKNLTDLNQEEECSNCYTGVICYYNGEDGTVWGSMVSTGITLGYTRNLLVDLTEEFETLPDAAALTEAASDYIDSHEMTTPRVSLTVSFQQVDETFMERVTLCDTVSVFFEPLGVSAKAKIIRTVYDVLLERYESLEIGSVRNSLADTILTVEKEAELAPTKSTMQSAINRATELLTGAYGGYVRLNRDANGNPYEILIMDTDDEATAQRIWRWNQNGLGYSDDYGQNYGLAMTADGEIVADYISTGILRSGDDGESFYLNLGTGELRMKAADIYLGSTNLADTISQVSENTSELVELGNYISYNSTTGVLTLGDSNSEIALKIENDRVAFVDVNSDDELAYFTNSRLMIADATIINSLDFGNYRLDTSHNGITFRWVG